MITLVSLLFSLILLVFPSLSPAENDAIKDDAEEIIEIEHSTQEQSKLKARVD